MNKKKIKPNGMRKNILSFLDTKGKVPLKDMKNKLRSNYQTYPAHIVSSSVEEQVLHLCNSGKVDLSDNDLVSLTEEGRNKYQEMRTIKQRNRAMRHARRASAQKRIQTNKVHESIKDTLAEIGQFLGKSYEKECLLIPGGPVRLDLVWYENCEMSNAFEVQNHGDIKNAIHNLEAVGRQNPFCRLCLVICDDKDLKIAKQMLGTTLNKSIKLVHMKDVQICHKTVAEVSRKLPQSLWKSLQDVLASFAF